MPVLQARDNAQIILGGGSGATLNPAPLAIDPTETWIGNDGLWSPVTIGIGTPPQFVQLLVSTTATTPWVVLDVEQSCKDAWNTSTPCAQSRGGLFNRNASTTWNNTGLYDLNYERNLGIYASGSFGMDSITLGLHGSKGGNIMGNQSFAGIVNNNFWVATWGIRPDYTNITTLNNRYPSLLHNLKDTGRVPSLSWGYTAGANYRSGVTKTAAVSLTFGGSDISRYQRHNVTFDMTADVARDLVVGIRSISSNHTTDNLLPTPILSFMDAGVPHIWLPKDACSAFEKAFNLTFNETLQLYLVEDAAHESLLQRNPNVTFTLGNDLDNNKQAVNISLPYSAFDLRLTSDYPNVTVPTRYFPLRQAQNSTQYTLGRAFWQEAYVVADYERRKFSVHQTLFPGTVNQSLIAIAPLPGTGPKLAGGIGNLSTGAAVGITVGAIVFLVLLFGILFRCRERVATLFSRVLPKKLRPVEKAAFEVHGVDARVEVQGSRPIPPELAGREKEQELDGVARHELTNGQINASEIDSESRASVSSTHTIQVEGLFELAGSDNGTLVTLPNGSGSDVSGFLSPDYVNEDYATKSAYGSVASIESSVQGQALPIQHNNPESDTASAPSASVYTRDSMMDPDDTSTIQGLPTNYSPISRSPSIVFNTPRFDLPATPIPAVLPIQHMNSTFGAPRSESPLTMQPDSCSSTDRPAPRCSHIVQGTGWPACIPCRERENSKSSEPSTVSALSTRTTIIRKPVPNSENPTEQPCQRGSQASELSIVSAISPRPSISRSAGGVTNTDHQHPRISAIRSVPPPIRTSQSSEASMVSALSPGFPASAQRHLRIEIVPANEMVRKESVVSPL